MAFLSDAPRFRRLLAGAALVIGPALVVALELIHPEPDSNAAQMYAIVSENANRWYLAHAIALVALAAAIPAVLGLMHVLKSSRPAWGHAGAALTFLGLLPLAALVGMEFVIWQATAGDSAAMVSLIDRLNDSPGIALIWVLSLLFPIGWIALAIGLYLAREVPAWQPAAIGVGIAGVFAGDAAYAKWLAVAASIVFFAGAASVGWRLLTQSDEEWERGEAPGAARAVPTA